MDAFAYRFSLAIPTHSESAGVRAFAIAGLSTLGDRQAVDSRRGSEHSGRCAVAGPSLCFAGPEWKCEVSDDTGLCGLGRLLQGGAE
jgi:hypothetical protein